MNIYIYLNHQISFGLELQHASQCFSFFNLEVTYLIIYLSNICKKSFASPPADRVKSDLSWGNSSVLTFTMSTSALSTRSEHLLFCSGCGVLLWIKPDQPRTHISHSYLDKLTLCRV